MSEAKSDIIVEALGSLSKTDDKGLLRTLGSVKFVLRKTGRFDYDIEIIRTESGNRILRQPVTAEINLYYPGHNAVEWMLCRENAPDERIRFEAHDPNNNLRLFSVAYLEAQFQQDISAIYGDDALWASESIAMPDIDGDEKDAFDYDDSVSQRHVRMSDAHESRGGPAGGGYGSVAAEDDEEEEEEVDHTPAFKTPVKRAEAGGAGAKPLASSTRKGKDQNSLLVTAMNLNRSFISRGSQLGVLGCDEEGQLEALNRIPAVKDKLGNTFTPAKLQLHGADRQLLMLSKEDQGVVMNMDLETGKVVDEWRGKEGMSFRNIAPVSKYAQTTNEQLVVGVNDKGVFTLDPRISGANKIAQLNEYASKVFFSSLATSQDGFLAVASDKGDIRLYDKIDKRAKTQLPGLGNPVTHLDVTADGEWLLATTKTYLVVYPLKMGNGKLGFNDRMGKEKPVPLKLAITPEDMLRYGIKEVNFTPAFFNTGTIANTSEQWIATSTGPFVITWNFLRVKQGQRSAYKIQKTQEQVVMDRFRHNYSNDLLIAQTNDVYVSKLRRGEDGK